MIKNIKLSFQDNRESFVLCLEIIYAFYLLSLIINGDIVLHNKAQTVRI